MARIRIEKLVPGGEGFGRLSDGRPVFVPGALPGDEVEVTELLDRRQFARAQQFRLEVLGPERRTAPCRVVERCGACDWMALTEGAQREHKVRLLEEALRRTGGFHEIEFAIDLRTAGPPTHYRQRVRLHFDEEGRMGYHARGSHDLTSAAECLVLAPELERAVSLLDAERQRSPALFAVFEDVEVRALDEERSLAFRLRSDARPDPALLTRLGRCFSVRAGVGGGSGVPRLARWPLTPSVYLLAAPGDFTQVNWHINRLMVAELLDGVARRELRTFADLYTGVGNFALPLLAAGLVGCALDSNASAIESARQAASAQGLDPETFACRDVGRWLEKRERGRFDLVVIDPPRAGVSGDPRAIERLSARTLVMCACDPVTFARDLRRFVALGFRVEKVLLCDMFPQTHHFEILAWLDR